MNLLITGGTGLVGRALAARLSAHRVIVLSRNPERAAWPGIETLAGDVSQPRLGLSESRYSDLQRTLDGVLHAAADVRFNASLASARAVNVEGTINSLALARGCKRLERFAYISTVYVNGLLRGEFREEILPDGHSYLNTYQQTKHEAEALVEAAMRDIPVAIFRLSTVVADSPDGRVSQFNYMHQVMRHLADSPLEMIPGSVETRLDLITNDWATAALAFLFEHRFIPGSVRHLCAGPKAALPVGDAIEIGSRVLEAAGGSSRPVRVPRLVSPAEFTRYLVRSRGQGFRKLAGVLGRFLPLLAAANTYRNDLASEELAPSGLVCPEPRDYFANVIRYCLAAGWGKGAQS